MMKNIIYISLFIFSLNTINAQGLNGIYQAEWTQFVNPNNQDKSFENFTDDKILIDYNQLNGSNGYLSLITKSEGESLIFKYKIIDDVIEKFEDGYNVLEFKTYFVPLNLVLEDDIVIINLIYNDDEMYFIINLTDKVHQIWILKGKI